MVQQKGSVIGKNQFYIIDLELIQWIEFLDDKFEILVNKGKSDEVNLLVSKNEFPEIKSNLLVKMFSLM